MDGVVSGGDGEGAALYVQGLLGVDGVVDRGVDGEGQLTDGQGRLALLGGGGAGLDAVFAVGGDGQAAGAAQGHLGAVLALDDGVFRRFVVGIFVVVVVLSAVGQAVDGALRRDDGDLGGLIAGDGGGVGAGEGQTVQHQRHAGGALLHGNGAVGAGAGDGVGARAGDGEGRAVDLIAGVAAVLGGDAAVGKGEDGGVFQGIEGAGYRSGGIGICIGIG